MAGRSQQGNAWQEIFKHIIKVEVIHTKIWAAVPKCCTIVANFTINNSEHLTCWAWFDIFTDGGFKEKEPPKTSEFSDTYSPISIKNAYKGCH